MQPPAHLTIVTGTESLLVTRAIRSTVARVREVVPDIQRDDLDAEDEESAGRLLNALSPSLFGEPMVIVVRDIAEASDGLVAALVDGLSNLADDIWVIVVWSGERNKNKKAVDAVRKVKVPGGSTEIACETVKPGRATRTLLETEARAAGRRITPDGMEALIAALGSDASMLVGGLEQLVADNPDGTITEGMVSKTFPMYAKNDAFKVADAMWEGRNAEAVQQLRIGLETQAFAGPAVVAVLAMKARQMVLVAGAPKGMSEGEVAAMAKVPPFRVQATRALAHRWGQKRLADAIVELAELDGITKGRGPNGESLEPVQKDAALERFVMRMGRPD